MARPTYRNLGKSGLRVSSLGFGTWVTFGGQVTDEVAEELLTVAYERGINFFDTAEVYSAGKAELVLGKILKKKKWRRSSYIISTKIYWGGKAETEKGLSRKHIIEGIQASLQRLQLDYVDVVFANKADSHVPMEEIVRAMTFVINQGWVMYWGTSRWSTMEIMEAYSVARQFNLIPPIAEQAEYHYFQREKVELQMPEMYHKIGVGTITWSPLACGILTGKYEDGIPIYSRAALKGYSWLKEKILSDEGRQKQSKLRSINVVAEQLGCSLAQLAIAWCVKNENVSQVLLGASTVDQLCEDIQALQFVPKLTSGILEHLEAILETNPRPVSPTTSVKRVFSCFDDSSSTLYSDILTFVLNFAESNCDASRAPVDLSSRITVTDLEYLPKLTPSVMAEIDHILGNRPWPKEHASSLTRSRSDLTRTDSNSKSRLNSDPQQRQFLRKFSLAKIFPWGKP